MENAKADLGGCPKATKQLNTPRARWVCGCSCDHITLMTPHEEMQRNSKQTPWVIKNPLQNGGVLLAKLPAHICQMWSVCK
jgi:hypothetical protein